MFQVEFRRKPLLSFRKQALTIGMGQTQRDANKKEECRKGVTSDSKRHGRNEKQRSRNEVQEQTYFRSRFFHPVAILKEVSQVGTQAMTVQEKQVLGM